MWAKRGPAWVADVRADPNFPRAQAAGRAGLRSAFCFPVRGAGRVLGAIEFFTEERREPDDVLLDTMASLGHQIGQYVERRRAEQAVHESEARKSAILNAAFDCIITMSHDGRVVEVNHAAEQMFGYGANEMVGRELAELVIPPPQREAHRRGLAHYLKTGEGPVIGRRLEMTAMRSDGSEFRVELAITLPQVPGPPLFTGYLRDLTERKRAERELRALAEEQAALRRVATIVAGEPDQQQVFAVVTEEVARLLSSEIANIIRYDSEASATVMGGWSGSGGADDADRGDVPARRRDGRREDPAQRPARADRHLRRADGGARSAAAGAGLSIGGRGADQARRPAVGRDADLDVPRGPLPPRCRGTGRRLHRARRAGAGQRRGPRAAGRLASPARAGQRHRAPAAGAQPPQRRAAAAGEGAAVPSTRRAQAGQRSGTGPRAARTRRHRARRGARGATRAGPRPAPLTHRGLGPALQALAARSPVPVELADEVGERLPEPIEAAVYYVVAEALTNVAKHAKASTVRVRITQADGRALVEVADDGRGGAEPDGGSGLGGLADRVEALGGDLDVASPTGAGTAVRASIPYG